MTGVQTSVRHVFFIAATASTLFACGPSKADIQAVDLERAQLDAKAEAAQKAYAAQVAAALAMRPTGPCSAAVAAAAKASPNLLAIAVNNIANASLDGTRIALVDLNGHPFPSSAPMQKAES